MSTEAVPISAPQARIELVIPCFKKVDLLLVGSFQQTVKDNKQGMHHARERVPPGMAAHHCVARPWCFKKPTMADARSSGSRASARCWRPNSSWIASMPSGRWLP